MHGVFFIESARVKAQWFSPPFLILFLKSSLEKIWLLLLHRNTGYLDSTYYRNSKILSAFKWEQDSFMMTVKQEQICPMIKQVNLFLSQDPDSIGLDCQYCVSSTPQQSNSSKKCTCFLSEWNSLKIFKSPFKWKHWFK